MVGKYDFDRHEGAVGVQRATVMHSLCSKKPKIFCAVLLVANAKNTGKGSPFRLSHCKRLTSTQP